MARQPYSGCGSRLDRGSGSSQLWRHGIPPGPTWTPACMHGEETGLSRGEVPSGFNSGGDEASFTSGVPHHTPPDLAVSAPLLSHTPTPVGSLAKGGVKGWGDDDDKGKNPKFDLI